MFKDSITWLSIIVNVSSRLSGITQLGTFIKLTGPSVYIKDSNPITTNSWS